MTQYKVSNLKSDTAAADQEKLKTALQGVNGIKSVTVEPARSEVSVSFEGNPPDHSLIASAVSKAGFTLGAKV